MQLRVFQKLDIFKILAEKLKKMIFLGSSRNWILVGRVMELEGNEKLLVREIVKQVNKYQDFLVPKLITQRCYWQIVHRSTSLF